MLRSLSHRLCRVGSVVKTGRRHCSGYSGLLDTRFLEPPPRTPQDIEVPKDEEDQYFLRCFNDPEITGWKFRGYAFNMLKRKDVIVHPEIIKAALRACRRMNEYALAVRLLEICKYSTEQYHKVLWSMIQADIKPLMDELGISTVEEHGYDKPELYLKHQYEIANEQYK